MKSAILSVLFCFFNWVSYAQAPGISEDGATQLVLRDLQPSERKLLAEGLVRAQTLAGERSPSSSVLDRAWAKWLESGRQGNEEDLVAFGLAFGDLLVRTRDFEWVFGADQWGDGLAVVALRGSANVTIFPTDFVAKRYQSRESSFFTASLPEIGASVSRLRSEWKVERPN